LPIQTILHPTDFSQPAEWAFRLACSLAREHDARLVVLHVAPPPFYGMALLQQDGYEGLRKDLHELQAPDFTIQLEHQLRLGDRLTQILRVAQEIQCDLIVMGSHRRSPLRRLLKRSFAETLVRRAPCPALAVQTPFPEGIRVAAAHRHAPFFGKRSRDMAVSCR
jgi:nucleotide-binding universal stress UspA family protein